MRPYISNTYKHRSITGGCSVTGQVTLYCLLTIVAIHIAYNNYKLFINNEFMSYTYENTKWKSKLTHIVKLSYDRYIILLDGR